MERVGLEPLPAACPTQLLETEPGRALGMDGGWQERPTAAITKTSFVESLVTQRHSPSLPLPWPLHPRCWETVVFEFISCLCQGPSGRRKQKSHPAYFKVDLFQWRQPWRVILCLHCGGHSVRWEECFFEGWLTVRLGSKHLLGTVSLWGFCMERAVRHETSDFCGTSCYQSDIRGLQFRVPWSIFLKFCFHGVGWGGGGMVKSNSWEGTHKGGADFWQFYFKYIFRMSKQKDFGVCCVGVCVSLFCFLLTA